MHRSFGTIALLAACLAPSHGPAQAALLTFERLAVASPDVALIVGEITDAVSDGRRIVVASEREGRLVVLSPQLTVQARIGRRGSGPGEFRELRAVRRGADGSVLALDRALRRLYRYGWVGDSLRLQQSTPLPLDPYDVVPLADGTVWILGPHAGARLHRIGADGRVLESRWPQPGSGSTAVAEQLAQDGWLQRTADGFLVVSPYVAGVITVPDRASASTRIDSLPGFQATTVEPYRNGVTVRSGPAGASAPMRPVRLVGDRWLVQAAVVARQDGGDERPMQWMRTSTAMAWQGPQRADYRVFPLTDGELLVQYDDDTGTLVRARVRAR